MRKDPRVGGCDKGTGKVTKNPTQKSPRYHLRRCPEEEDEGDRHLNQNATPGPNPQTLAPQGPIEYWGLDEFCRRNSTQFEGGFAPEAANEWIQSLECIFRAMGCSNDTENWSEYALRQMESEGQAITWEAFKEKFLQKYFPTDLKRKKEMEFLWLEQGVLSVGEYATKFEELARYCPYYDLEVDGRSKCTKFESGLKPKLKAMFGYQEISDFPTLVNKCRMYKDDLRTEEFVACKTNPSRNVGPQRSHIMDKGKWMMFGDNRKPYAPPSGYRSRGPQRSKPLSTPGGFQHDSYPLCSKCGCDTLNLSSLRCGNSPEESDILPNSHLSERVLPKRETQCFNFGNYENLTQARNWSLEREKPRQAARFSLERENLAQARGFVF
ncbi:hypothetical protein Lal_00032469 [Lupinus albus]|nr:hypothetical protein Lal_00032469 [Lupinus albus]